MEEVLVMLRSISDKLDQLLEANERLEKERTELAESMKSGGLGSIFDIMNGQ